jgi:uncharacterized protein YcnI
MVGRVGVVVVGAVAVVAGLAGPASAHVEVSADKAQAGATDVTVSFSAESESKTAGITSLRVVLPDGIKPADVAWVSGPAGWTLTSAADGYTVAGPAVAAGEDAKYFVKITKLPVGAAELAFKTLQTYSDGKIYRWIESPSPGAAAPDSPAPVLKVQPAAAAPAATASAIPAPAPAESTAAAPAATTAAETAKTSSTSSAWWWIPVAVVVVAAAAGGGRGARRRAGTGGEA